MSPRNSSILTLAAVAALSSLHAEAASLCVNPGGTAGCFASIAAAVSASTDGDTVMVAPGVYSESNIFVDRSVNISGAGVGATIVDGGSGGGNGPFTVFRYPGNPGGVTATLSGLTVQHGSRGVDLGGGNVVTLDHMRATANGPATGAGVFNGASVLYLTYSTLDGNVAADPNSIAGCDWGGASGGGLASLCGGGNNYISGSAIINNNAGRWGGGIIINDGITVIENTTIANNGTALFEPTLGGGALFMGGAFPDVTIRYSTIAFNRAGGNGGAFQGDEKVKVYASVMQHNVSGTSSPVPNTCAVGSTIASLGYNIVDDASCGFSGAGDLNSTNPLAGPPLNNGGPTVTEALGPGSPAIDHVPVCTIAIDQRGVARPQGAPCDAGAYEWFDTIPPFINNHPPVIVEATSAAGAVATYDLPPATDNVGVVSLSCTPVSGSVFPLGVSPVQCTATDAAGNVGHSAFPVNVMDRTPPVINVPPAIAVPATNPAGANVSFTITATDLVDGTIPASCLPASGSAFPLGDTIVRCNAIDAHGNPAMMKSFPLHVAGVNEQITILLTLLAGLPQPTPFVANIAGAITMFAMGHRSLACALLADISRAVSRAPAGSIPPPKVALIVGSIGNIRGTMGCSP